MCLNYDLHNFLLNQLHDLTLFCVALLQNGALCNEKEEMSPVQFEKTMRNQLRLHLQASRSK